MDGERWLITAVDTVTETESVNARRNIHRSGFRGRKDFQEAVM